MKLENLNILTEDGFIKGNISFDESIISIEKTYISPLFIDVYNLIIY